MAVLNVDRDRDETESTRDINASEHTDNCDDEPEQGVIIQMVGFWRFATAYITYGFPINFGMPPS